MSRSSAVANVGTLAHDLAATDPIARFTAPAIGSAFMSAKVTRMTLVGTPGRDVAAHPAPAPMT